MSSCSSGCDVSFEIDSNRRATAPACITISTAGIQFFSMGSILTEGSVSPPRASGRGSPRGRLKRHGPGWGQREGYEPRGSETGIGCRGNDQEGDSSIASHRGAHLPGHKGIQALGGGVRHQHRRHRRLQPETEGWDRPTTAPVAQPAPDETVPTPLRVWRHVMKASHHLAIPSSRSGGATDATFPVQLLFDLSFGRTYPTLEGGRNGCVSRAIP